MALADDRPRMTIVLVTDGLFGRERCEDILQAITTGQERRKTRAVIGVYGLGARSKALDLIAAAGGGGYVREVPDPEPVPPDLGPPRHH